jgi:hypothetical protein
MNPATQAPLRSATAKVQSIIARDPRKKNRIKFMEEWFRWVQDSRGETARAGALHRTSLPHVHRLATAEV